jgi:hypothetical protein
VKYPTFRLHLLMAAVLAIAVLAISGAGVAGADSSPSANAAKTCKNIRTNNGGSAQFINTTGKGLSCKTARRVAKRAKGKRKYAALGFECTGRKQRGEFQRLYGCGRVHNGNAQGIGFFYAKP